MRLYIACRAGDDNAVANLLYTSDVNLQLSDGMTALHVACMYGHVEATLLLLSVWTKIDITDNDRRTPAMLAQQLRIHNTVAVLALYTD
jgi:ankyrin repeat protein